jgi:hypothetical protein
MVYNRSASRLQAGTKNNSKDMWIRTQEDFDQVDVVQSKKKDWHGYSQLAIEVLLPQI